MPHALRRLALLTSLFCLVVTGMVLPSAGTALAALPAGTSFFTPLDHAKVADTRVGYQMGFTRINTTTIRVPLGTKVPADATAVVLNVNGWNSAGFGGVTVYPHGESVTGTAHVVVTGKGQSRSNLVTVRIGQLRSVDLKQSIAMGLTVDLVGYYSKADPVTLPSAGRFLQLAGTRRVADSRAVAAGGSAVLNLNSVGVPVGASAAVLTISNESGGKGGWSAFAYGTTRPLTSELFVDAAGAKRSSQTIVKLSDANASVRIYSQAGGNVSVDVIGYYTGAGDVASSDGLFIPMPAGGAYRRLDTRKVSLLAPIGPTSTEFAPGTGTPVRNVVGNFRILDAWDAGRFTSRPAGVSTADVPIARSASPRENVSMHFYARSSSRGVGITMTKGAHVVVDIAGWFLGSRPTATIAATKLNLLAATPAVRVRWFDATGAHSIPVEIATTNTTYATTLIADKGYAAAFKGMGTLGKTGNTMLFAHRTSHGGPFYFLNTIPIGATFGIKGANGKWYNYRVVRHDVTFPAFNLINPLAAKYPPVTAQLIACSKPDGTPTSTSYRLSVTGILVSVTST